jgi:UDP-N-acetylmuramoylalanine--D-glutamate ligase
MNITVIGAGKSGKAAAILAKNKGNNVFVTESKNADGFTDVIREFEEMNIEFEFGGNTKRALKNADLIITSPGVLPSTSIIKEAEEKNIEIISELEFAYSYITNPIIAITGTNGKTTTTALTAHIFNHSGRKAVTAGNIGTPLSELVDKVSPDTVLVVEVSSFQLDRIKTFRPNVAVILNISPDHLYYHGTFESYQQSKWKIFSNQIEKDLLILNRDNAATMGGMPHTKGDIAYFSMTEVPLGIFKRGNEMIVRYPSKVNEEVIMLFDELSLPGIHNAYNSMAAALAARAFEIRNEDIRDSLMCFKGVEHRLEFVRTLRGIDFINDSKATNINATWYALASYNRPIVWIAGGRGDNNDYSELDELVEKNVKAIVCIGEEADNIFKHYCTKLRCIKADNLDDAVHKAKDLAVKGDIVLFTPACKSFDMFMNFEHRGEVFKEIVNNLS